MLNVLIFLIFRSGSKLNFVSSFRQALGPYCYKVTKFTVKVGLLSKSQMLTQDVIANLYPIKVVDIHKI